MGAEARSWRLALPPALALVALAFGVASLLQAVDPPDPATVGRLGPLVPLVVLLEGLPWGLWGSVALLALGVRAARTVARRGEEPLPAYLVVATLAVVLSSYNWSNLDWLALPLEARVADGGVPQWTDLALPLLPLAAAMLYNVAVQWAQAERDYLERGVAAEEARQVRRLLPSALPFVGGAALLTLAVAAVFHWAATERLAAQLPVVPSVLLFPLLAVAVLVALAYLAARRPRRTPQAGGSGGTASGP